jgi:hypothetical protein
MQDEELDPNKVEKLLHNLQYGNKHPRSKRNSKPLPKTLRKETNQLPRTTRDSQDEE